jgi:DNA-binding transcriptional MerR regulator
MKISELVKRTGVSKETIHYYIREGVLRKPRKTGRNTADYNEGYVQQIRIIKALRENYYLPVPVIKKLIKKNNKQSHSEQSSLQFMSEFFRPLDQLITSDVVGRQAFMEVTGMGEKWLRKMEAWHIITAEDNNGEIFYSQDDVIIGKLLVDMDRVGIGPRDGFDPEELRHFTDLFRDLVAKNLERLIEVGWCKMDDEEFIAKGRLSTEVMSLFFYHIYRKLVKEEYYRHVGRIQNKETETAGE